MKRIEKEMRNDKGEVVGWRSKPHPIDKYWSRIKMYFKKEHIQYCACYWCLKERFTSDETCPKCKKRKLKITGYHINRGPGHHDSGYTLHCKCGYDGSVA